MRKHLLLVLSFLLVPAALVLAQGFHNAKYSGDYLGLGVGARSSGLGGTGTSFANDVTAGYFNPAALALLNYPEIAAFHESRFSGQINYDYLGAALPLSRGQTIAISAIRQGIDGIKDTRAAHIDVNGNHVIDEDDRLDPNKITLGSASDWALFGSYSRAIDSQLSVGGNVKVLYRTILDSSAWGVGVDLSASYRPIDNLMIGATLTDATKTLLTWQTGNQEFVVPALRLGAAYKYMITPVHSVMPVIDGTFRFEGRHATTLVDLGFASLDMQAGLEYSFKDRAFVRGGYTELGQWSVGAGIRLPKLNIDYAFTQEGPSQEILGPTHRVSLMLTLEEPKFLRGE
jgi:hypothetical protein